MLLRCSKPASVAEPKVPYDPEWHSSSKSPSTPRLLSDLKLNPLVTQAKLLGVDASRFYELDNLDVLSMYL